MDWELIHHLADLAGLTVIVVGIISSRLQKWKRYKWMIEEDHKRVTALWREHGYNGWNGEERRKEQR